MIDNIVLMHTCGEAAMPKNQGLFRIASDTFVICGTECVEINHLGSGKRAYKSMATEFLSGIMPAEMAEYVYASGDLVFNPFESGSIEFKQFVDRLLELTSGEGE